MAVVAIGDLEALRELHGTEFPGWHTHRSRSRDSYPGTGWHGRKALQRGGKCRPERAS